MKFFSRSKKTKGNKPEKATESIVDTPEPSPETGVSEAGKEDDGTDNHHDVAECPSDTVPIETEQVAKKAEEQNVAAVSLPDDVEKRLGSLELNLSGVREVVEAISCKLDSNQHREGLIDKLHAENQHLKSGIYQKLMLPFVNEIIFLIDDYTKLRKNYEGKEVAEIDTGELLKQFCGIVDDLEDALCKNGIEAHESATGSVADFAKQRIIKTVPSDKPEKDKTVCACLKKGFVFEGKIIRQEQVSCYKYETTLSGKEE